MPVVASNKLDQLLSFSVCTHQSAPSWASLSPWGTTRGTIYWQNASSDLFDTGIQALCIISRCRNLERCLRELPEDWETGLCARVDKAHNFNGRHSLDNHLCQNILHHQWSHIRTPVNAVTMILMLDCKLWRRQQWSLVPNQELLENLSFGALMPMQTSCKTEMDESQFEAVLSRNKVSFYTNCLKRTSSSQGAPNEVPLSIWAFKASFTSSTAWPAMAGPQLST